MQEPIFVMIHFKNQRKINEVYFGKVVLTFCKIYQDPNLVIAAKAINSLCYCDTLKNKLKSVLKEKFSGW